MEHLEKILIEDISGVKKKLNLKVDKKRAEEAYNRRLADTSRKSNIKGFRPGKAPLSVIKKYYGPELYEEAMVDVLNEDFRKIVSENNIHVAGTPRLEKKHHHDHAGEDMPHDHAHDHGEEGEFTIYFEVMPAIKDLNLDLKIKAVEKRKITPEVIDEEVDFLLERAATSVPLDNEAVINQQDRYFVKIDYITIDNKTDKEVDSAKNYSISLNSKMIEKPFESIFIGKKKGDAFEYIDAERNVTVKGVIKGIDRKIMPALDAETMKNFGDFKDAEEFRSHLGKTIGDYEEKRYNEQIKSEVTEELLKLNPVEFPESMIEENAHARFEELKRQEKYKDADAKKEQEIMQILKILAKKDLTTYLLLSEVAKRENISVTEADLDGFFRKAAEESSMKEEEIRKYYSEKEARANLRQALLDDKIFDFLISNKVSYI